MDTLDMVDLAPRRPTLRLLSGQAPARPRPRYEVAASTHRGYVRQRNEDQYLVASLERSLCIGDTSVVSGPRRLGGQTGWLLGVADGVGSIPGGEVASAMALDAVAEHVHAELLQGHDWAAGARHITDGFDACLRACQERMIKTAQRKQLDARMATTLTVALLQGRTLQIAHVGDSRAYLFRRGTLLQLTRDQTLAEELIAQGALTRAEALRTRYAHTLTAAVGGAESDLRLIASEETLEPGDLVLLCTDGLHGQLDGQQLRRCLDELGADGDLHQAVHCLEAEALAAGGRDNVTLVLARFRGDSRDFED